ncbi:unnamed protein product, partial [Ceratitis capitata]
QQHARLPQTQPIGCCGGAGRYWSVDDDDDGCRCAHSVSCVSTRITAVPAANGDLLLHTYVTCLSTLHWHFDNQLMRD